MKKYLCEAIGTAVLVLFGCGAAVITGNTLTIALTFGLSIIAMAYVIGNISGCHINPAVSLAMLINKKITVTEFLFYVLAQIVGAFVGAALLFFLLTQSQVVIDMGKQLVPAESTTQAAETTENGEATEGDATPNEDANKEKTYSDFGYAVKGITDKEQGIGLGTNGFEEKSSLQIKVLAAFVTEVILTFVFIYTILGVTSDEKKSAVAGIVIGLTLAFVHIIGISITGTSVNPARSLAPATILAIAGNTVALKQVWVFIVAPFVGSALAAFAYKFLNKEKEA